MGTFLFFVGLLNIWMCGAQCVAIRYEKIIGNDVSRSKYVWAVIDLVLGLYLSISSIGYFCN